MRSAIIFACFFAVVVSGPVIQEDDWQENQKFFAYEDENGNIQIEDLSIPPENFTASAADVTYHFFSKSNPSNSIKIHSNAIAALSKTHFSAAKDTLFIVHGWQNSHLSDVNSHIRENILRGHDVNVFVVDWSPVAGKTYGTAQKSVQAVGGIIADFVKGLEKSFHLNVGRVKFVGHSLGAHVSGCAGAALGGRVDRIVGLDPAGPYFSINNHNNRIGTHSARFVQIIHTNAGKLGFNGELGHADYWPNGGKTQAGCGTDLLGTCSHGRSFQYYAESLNSKRFVARQCGSIADYNSGKCKNGHASVMGQFTVDTGARGKFFLATNAKAPFAKG